MDDESEMIFAGFISLFDPPKKGIGETIQDIKDLKIDLKVITEDNALIAKNIAKQVSMEDAEVLIEGVKEGRRTFTNTQKYIFMATSANFGNMFSMAGASMFLPFLPLLPNKYYLQI